MENLFGQGIIQNNSNLLFHQFHTTLFHFLPIPTFQRLVNPCNLATVLFYSHQLRVSFKTLLNPSYYYSLICAIVIPSTSAVKIKQPIIENRKQSTTALYISNMPFLPIKNVKAILAGDPIRIHLQYIYNVSWIDKRILELLVDSNHADQIKNRIGKHSDY